MFLYLILCFLGLALLLFSLFMLMYYEWNSLSSRRKCLELPHPQMYFIVGLGIELIKYPFDEILNLGMKLMKELGHVYHYSVLGVPCVMLSNPEDIEILFNNIKYVSKGKEYDFMRPWLGNGLLTSTGDHWHRRRKQLTPSFHFKILENYLAIFNENAKLLTDKLLETQGKAIASDSLISSCTLNIICETTMGTSLNLLTRDAREYAQAVKEVSEITAFRVLTFWLHSNFVFFLSKKGRRYRKLMRKMHSFVDQVIEERRRVTFGKTTADEEGDILAAIEKGGMYKQRKSFLDHLLNIQKDDPSVLSDNDIRDEVNTFMFEGHDTIAAAITWTLFMLANHPEVQDRVRYELCEVFSHGEDRHATMEDLSKLQYLEMVLKEALRLFPSVPFMTRRIPFDLQIVTGQYLIPAGTNVAVLPYLVHRSPDVFEDPEKFDPERFSPARAKTYHPYAYLPFSAGYRNCIGQRFAIMEGKVVLSTILRKFQVSSTQKREDIKVEPSVVLRPSPRINLSFTPAALITL